MSLFLNDSAPPPEIVDLDFKEDDEGDDDLSFAIPTKKPRKRPSSRPARALGAHKRRKHDTTQPAICLDDEIFVDGPCPVTSSPHTMASPDPLEPLRPAAPPKPVDLADQILWEDEPVAKKIPSRIKPVFSSAPLYHLSDPDVSTAFAAPSSEGPEAFEVSLQVSPELLNTVKNQERKVEDRESPKRFVFKLYATQKLRLIVDKFLEIDQSTWKLDDLQLRLHGLDVPLDHTPRDEGMIGGEELHLFLKAQPKGDLLSPLDFAPLPDKIEIEESEAEKISVILQSRNWGEQTYRMAMDKPFGQLYDSFAKQNNLTAQEKRGLALQFDGEAIGKGQTPEDLDMENEDTVDVVIKKMR